MFLYIAFQLKCIGHIHDLYYGETEVQLEEDRPQVYSPSLSYLSDEVNLRNGKLTLTRLSSPPPKSKRCARQVKLCFNAKLLFSNFIFVSPRRQLRCHQTASAGAVSILSTNLANCHPKTRTTN